MTSCLAKIGLKRPRKKENNNYRSTPFRSYPTLNRKFQKNSKKFQKVNEYHYGLISSQNRLEKDEKERKKKLLLHFISTRSVIENFKKIAKKFKKIKIYHYAIISSENRLEKAGKERI